MWWWILVIAFILFLAYIWRRSERVMVARPEPVLVETTQSTSPVEPVWPQSATFTGPAADLKSQDPAPQNEPPSTGEDRYTPDPIVDGRIGLHRGDLNLPRPIPYSR